MNTPICSVWLASNGFAGSAKSVTSASLRTLTGESRMREGLFRCSLEYFSHNDTGFSEAQFSNSVATGSCGTGSVSDNS